MSNLVYKYTQDENGNIAVEGYIEDGGTLPAKCFLHENTAELGVLGDFIGVANLAELNKYNSYDPEVVKPKFGSPYLLHDSFYKLMDDYSSAQVWFNRMAKTLLDLQLEINTSGTENPVLDVPQTMNLTTGVITSG